VTGTSGLQDAAAVCELFSRAAEAMRSSPLRAGSRVELPSTGRLLATGDLHDNPANLRAIAGLARLDEPDHHVVLHEIIHGGSLVCGVDLSHRMLARAAEIVVAHPRQVHVLLANHELAQMTGQRVSKGAGDNVQLFDDGLEFAYGDDWTEVAEAIDGFIRAMPLAARSGSGILCAHSLPGRIAGAGPPGRGGPAFDPGVLDRPLAGADYRPGGAAHAMVWGRGFGEAEVEALAAAWKVSLFCLGHEHVENGIAVRGKRVVVLNSDHERAAVIPIDLSRVPTAEQAAQRAVWLRSVQ
jgi:hypothetical protein